MIAILLFFLVAALVFYVLFAGADFGAGILELFAGRSLRSEQRALISVALAPVWEANHVWLVLVVVILFMGFPPLYEALSVPLFIPVMAVLLGVVARGTAFTFRHYDAPDPAWQRVYNLIFTSSSLWTAVWLGLLAGGALMGRIGVGSGEWEPFVAPWAHLFGLSMALFTPLLFSFLAAVYLIEEAQSPALQAHFRRQAGRLAVGMVLAGALVFAGATAGGLPLVESFGDSPFSLGALGLASLILPFFARTLARGGPGLRGMGAAVVSLVLIGAFAAQYPVALRTVDGPVTFAEAVAPEPTQKALVFALFGGSAIIFPGLFYLFAVFKRQTFQSPPSGDQGPS
jgi:cytochrome d ubiquinol oxidase subunit II